MDLVSDSSCVSGAPRLAPVPSGRWRGFWIQSNRRFRADLNLLFRSGQVGGDGSDWIGDFTIRGEYSATDGAVWWIKAYRDGRRVEYRGFVDGVHGIWGRWEVAGRGAGGFQIWPDADAGVDEPPVGSDARRGSSGRDASVVARRDVDASAG